jgi:hypothetical protein
MMRVCSGCHIKRSPSHGSAPCSSVMAEKDSLFCPFAFLGRPRYGRNYTLKGSEKKGSTLVCLSEAKQRLQVSQVELEQWVKT